MRTALAAGVDYVWLLEGADPWQPKVLRASAGATLALPLKRFLEKKLLLQNLQILKGMQRVATRVNKHEVTPFIQPYWQLNWCKPTILFLGNEGSGLDPGLEAVCTDAVTIPHTSLVESLNVGVAAAPLLLERIRQKLTCGD
eukprot:gb/GEZN01003265.1/.p2 GENE.gb/GEZN01003265.1/~~gb/GEZN01003265.1/.p2  ORF type:complete len:142 (-),score=2.23 gb/GEZN01003265.1/:1391-1816(-)